MQLNRRKLTFGIVGAVAAAPFASVAQAQGAPLKIGLITQLTGWAQIYGEATKLGAEMAAQRINAAGGVNGRPIELVFRDDKAVADATVAAYRDLASEGVRFFTCGPISATAVALAPLFKGSDNILVATGATQPSITYELYNDNIFRLAMLSVPLYRGLGELMAEKAPQVRNWSVMTNDQQASLDIAKVFSQAVTQAHARKGVTIQVQEPIQAKAGAGDFRTQIARLASSGSTGVMNLLIGSDGLTFYKQAKAFGLDRKVEVFADVSANLNSMASIATATPQTVWTPYYWYPQQDKNPVSRELYKAVLDKTGEVNPYGFVIFGHDAVVALAEAAKAAGSLATRPMITALEQGKPLGAGGPIVFRKEDHTYLGEMLFIKFGADAAAKDGISVTDVLRMPSSTYMPAAAPGQKFLIA
ncbi:ABC transporter substrate-binding protein [soil metagenome]